MDIISELQIEMDKEQEKFDVLSVKLSRATDQGSASFKKLSAELVKCQNSLALLVARNMHCFKVVSVTTTIVSVTTTIVSVTTTSEMSPSPPVLVSSSPVCKCLHRHHCYCQEGQLCLSIILYENI